MFKSKTSKIERASDGLSLPLTAPDHIATTTQITGERVNDVMMLSILRRIARERRGCISSVMRSSLRCMKASQPFRRKERTFATYSKNTAVCLDSRLATAERALFMRIEIQVTQESARRHMPVAITPYLTGTAPFMRNHKLMATNSSMEPHSW